uniref:Uncharacterized protein n=1 Tax=viral metagenome TaxID=1070528 RepID=A0A6M3KU26_9ZZZZ
MQDINFPASGFGQQSRFYDDDILMDGTYRVISVTIKSTSRDTENTSDITKLRKGLLLAQDRNTGLYAPLSTADGYLNGDVPTQHMIDVVVLAREEQIAYDYILGGKRRRDVTPEDRVVPVYISCNIKEPKIVYNNMTALTITNDQWGYCQRIRRVPAGIDIFDRAETLARALLWNRKEVTITEQDFN